MDTLATPDAPAALAASAAPWRPAPTSTSTRSRYLIRRRAAGTYAFELRAHNGSVILMSDDDVSSPAEAEALIDRIRISALREEAFRLRQSLTGKWYFRLCDGEQVLAVSRPFDYRSRIDKALYAARACAANSRVALEAC
ncbi:hypothetical protein BH11PSE9_BH11PSE9_03630 [soil metagenome]